MANFAIITRRPCKEKRCLYGTTERRRKYRHLESIAIAERSATRTGKDSASVARIPVAARRLSSNSQKLITNLFHGDKGKRSCFRNSRTMERERERSSRKPGVQSCVSSRNCRWNFSPLNRLPLMNFTIHRADTIRVIRRNTVTVKRK